MCVCVYTCKVIELEMRCNKNCLIPIRIRPNNTKVIHKNVFLIHCTYGDGVLHDLWTESEQVYPWSIFTSFSSYIYLYLLMIQYRLIHIKQQTSHSLGGGGTGRGHEEEMVYRSFVTVTWGPTSSATPGQNHSGSCQNSSFSSTFLHSRPGCCTEPDFITTGDASAGENVMQMWIYTLVVSNLGKHRPHSSSSPHSVLFGFEAWATGTHCNLLILLYILVLVSLHCDWL